MTMYVAFKSLHNSFSCGYRPVKPAGHFFALV